MEDDETDLRMQAHRHLVESGERDRLIQVLRERLNSSDWKDQVTNYCREILIEKGVDNVTLDQLVERVTPKAREVVPNEIKRDMIQMIQNTLEAKFNVK